MGADTCGLCRYVCAIRDIIGVKFFVSLIS